MKFFLLIAHLAMISPSTLWALDCSGYNSMGSGARTLQELYKHKITSDKIVLVRKNTALKAGRVASIKHTPLALKLEKILSDKSLLAELASGTSTMVRAECFKSPERDFYGVVSEKFEYVVKYINKKNK